MMRKKLTFFSVNECNCSRLVEFEHRLLSRSLLTTCLIYILFSGVRNRTFGRVGRPEAVVPLCSSHSTVDGGRYDNNISRRAVIECEIGLEIAQQTAAAAAAGRSCPGSDDYNI